MNNITAQDLMIGDIVDVHRSECVADGGHYMEWNEYGKVVSITEDYITIKYNGREDDYGFEDVEEKDIEPIPLTSEILKRNGFEKVDGEYQNVFYCCDGLDLLIDDRLEPWCYTLYGVLELPIRYVHILQHALRLAGIDKEIKL